MTSGCDVSLKIVSKPPEAPKIMHLASSCQQHEVKVITSMRKTLSLWLFHSFSVLQTTMRLFDIFDPCLSGGLAQVGCSV